MMSEILDKLLLNYLQKAIREKKNSVGNISSKYKRLIGSGLGYYITDLLETLPESNIKNKWIDGVDWKELRLYSPNKIQGYGFIWWGFIENDTAETFPDKFYCNLELNTRTEEGVLYFFRFQLDRKNYELTNL